MPQSFYEPKTRGTSTCDPQVACRSCVKGIVYVSGGNDWAWHYEPHPGLTAPPYPGVKAWFWISGDSYTGGVK